MSELYNRIESLCKGKQINITAMCRESGAPRGSLTDLKKGRTSALNTKTLSKIAEFFGVTTDYLLTGEDTKKAPTQEDERTISDKELMFALWGDSQNVDESDLEDVRRYAAFVEERKKKK